LLLQEHIGLSSILYLYRYDLILPCAVTIVVKFGVVCVCFFPFLLIIYFQACPITYAILHALFYLPHCLSSCDFNHLVLSYIFYCFCYVRLLVSG
jgi:hypothetical protein